ncbi:MAG: hypothetical protein B7Z62_02060 [Deltaproteobacteria bacterium 37-65-8]|nr:MAG: hypothetical protein B7Z62_02060 [Deltaproteobacteria bacterium 37-65-8]
MKTVTLAQNHKHGDTQYYTGNTITLPDEDADWLMQAVIETRAANREKAAKIPGTPENKSFDPIPLKTDV